MDGLSQKILVNGCGACKGFFNWFKPPHHNFFKEECNTHDTLYGIGGDEDDRLNADAILLMEMKKKVKNYFLKRKPISRVWYLILCYLYFIGVRLFGKPNFNYEKKRNKFRF